MSPFSGSSNNPAGRTALLHRIYTEQYCIYRKIPGPFGERFITYADYIASSQALTFVEEYINDVVLPTYANTHTDASFTGRQTSHFREEARALIKQSVNADDEDVLLFCGSGSTGAIDTLFRQLTRTYQHRHPKPVVFIGPFEHHSNILPWRESDFTVVPVPLTGPGNVDVAFLAEQLRIYRGKQPIIGSFSAASNVTGIIAPIDEITTLLHQFGLMCLRVFCEGDCTDFDRLREPARKLGAAFQKVNFLRDLKSDFVDRGRTYFPGVDFNDFGRDAKQLIETDIQRDFDAAYIGIMNLPRGARMGVYLAYSYYQTLFNKIKQLPASRIQNERVRVPNPQKFALLAQTYLRYRLNVL